MRASLIASALLLAIGTAACTNDESATASAEPVPGKVTVYQAGPRVAQCEPVVLTPAQSALKLGNTGVKPLNTTCGLIEDVVFPSVCGGGTPEIIVHEIDEAGLAAAEAAGFASTDKLEKWRREPCAVHLRALQVAQQNPSCSDTRLRVLEIRRGDESWAFLDQADTKCKDASYRRLLFGPESDQPLCTDADTIAGPRKGCNGEEAPVQMFETITSNLDKKDLGLGSRYKVTEIFP
jgi:hypothetical protein